VPIARTQASDLVGMMCSNNGGNHTAYRRDERADESSSMTSGKTADIVIDGLSANGVLLEEKRKHAIKLDPPRDKTASTLFNDPSNGNAVFDTITQARRAPDARIRSLQILSMQYAPARRVSR
jgi:hypothetical protein